MYRHKVVWMVTLAIMWPYCSSLTQKEKKLLNKFDAQILQLKQKLQTLKDKLTSKVDKLNKDISTNNEKINDDILANVNKMKAKRLLTINKCNDYYKSRTTKYREQLKGKVEHFMDGYYNEQYKTSKSILDKTVQPVVKHLNNIGNEMKAKIGKLCIIIK